MLAYFLLVHRYPEQFKRLFKAIYEPGNQYVVHVDKSSGALLADNIAEFLLPYQGAQILRSQNALWGGYSLVEAELRGMELLLSTNHNWTHYINLSGQDFPLKTQNYIRQFLRAQPGKQFIRAVDQAQVRPETINRVDSYFIESFGKIIETNIARDFLADAQPYIGTQWKVVTRDFCEFVCHDPRVDRFKEFYKNSFIADESFFQTVLMNHFDHNHIVYDDLRMIDWVPDGDVKLRPRNFGIGDMRSLEQSRDLFARKFDSHDDPLIIGLLEAHLTCDAANYYVASNQDETNRPAAEMVPLIAA